MKRGQGGEENEEGTRRRKKEEGTRGRRKCRERARDKKQ